MNKVIVGLVLVVAVVGTSNVYIKYLKGGADVAFVQTNAYTETLECQKVASRRPFDIERATEVLSKYQTNKEEIQKSDVVITAIHNTLNDFEKPETASMGKALKMCIDELYKQVNSSAG